MVWISCNTYTSWFLILRPATSRYLHKLAADWAQPAPVCWPPCNLAWHAVHGCPPQGIKERAAARQVARAAPQQQQQQPRKAAAGTVGADEEDHAERSDKVPTALPVPYRIPS